MCCRLECSLSFGGQIMSKIIKTINDKKISLKIFNYFITSKVSFVYSIKPEFKAFAKVDIAVIAACLTIQ
jgi:hypothetical protein